MCALVRALTGRWDAAFLAGLAYAFNSFTLHELPRVHVLNVQWWPLLALFLVRFARARPRAGRGARAARRWRCSASRARTTSRTRRCCSPLWIVAAYAGARRVPTRREAAALAGALVVVGGRCCCRSSGPTCGSSGTWGSRRSWSTAPTCSSYVDPEADAALPWPRLGVARELPHFVGFVAAAAAMAGIVATSRMAPGRRRAAGRAGARRTAVVALLLSLGPVVRVGGAVLGPGPYALLHRLVPPARAGWRAPSASACW